MADHEARQAKHLEILKEQIDARTGTVDFSIHHKPVYGTPEPEIYRAAVRYAHIRYLNCCEHLNWLYDDIRKMRRQTLLNKARADGTTLQMVELTWVKRGLDRRITGVPQLRIGDETWIQGAAKWRLQEEISTAIAARRKVEEERKRFMTMAADAAKAERASR
ncbi:hypothetical protein LTR53_011124 [Teratosphaeriaceae sp. CCFEE 6253]|nr:hypothetical protein LTR53_011124 [Teratosphaeriaceae sp. CCFEE 6253]